jgi:phosphoenolpyruvate synthase/pyruvate phosphate dikinase
VVQGAVNPDEFYVYKPNVTAGRPAILRKTVGAKAIKMIFGDQPNAGDRRSRSMWNQATDGNFQSPTPKSKSWRDMHC